MNQSTERVLDFHSDRRELLGMKEEVCTRYCASLGGKAAIARRASLVVQAPPFGNAGTAATCIVRGKGQQVPEPQPKLGVSPEDAKGAKFGD